ncbi:MAG: hypothetical protein ACK5NG_09850 [Chthoniobacterales bacterium]
MIKLSKYISLALTLSLATSTLAGEGKSFKEEVIIVEEERTPWINASASTGWDSLYMFRGVNILRNNKSYGSALYWLGGDVTFNLTSSDSITLGVWYAVGTSVDYNEFNAFASYTKTIGNLSLTAGYTYYLIWPGMGRVSSHELNVGAAYEFDLGFMTLTPGITYYFNIGPGPTNGGFTPVASSYLDLRVDASIPVYKDGVISIDPWIAYGTNFRYNADNNGHFFNGANSLQIGIAVPFQITRVVGVSIYGAYSRAFNDLAITKPNTFWGGASVNFSF